MVKVTDYHYNITWSAHERCYVASVVEFPLLTCGGNTIEDVHREIKEIVKFSVYDLMIRQQRIPQPVH